MAVASSAQLRNARVVRVRTLAVSPSLSVRIAAGVYAFADSLDDDGAGTQDVGIRVTVRIGGGRAVVAFDDSDD